MAEQPIEIPIKLGGIGEIKKELRQIKSDIINATDPKEMEALAQRAGELTDRLRDANEQVNIFAGGSGFERLSNNLGDIGGKLASLDFEGASQSAKLLTTNIKSLDPKEIGTQIKGLASTVGSLGKAFFQMGLQILTNPIFLLATIIVAIVAAIGIFLNSLGLLKPIFDAIGKAIGFVVQMFKDLTDWLGITDNAGEDYAKKETARLEKLSAINKEYSDQKVSGYEREIKILKASGKDTEDVERAKQKEILRSAQTDFDILSQKITNRVVLSKMSNDELAELKKSFKASKEVLKDAKADLTAFNEQVKTDQREADKKENETRLKAQKEANDKILQARKDLRKKLKQDIIDNENETIELYKTKEKEKADLRKKQREDLDNAIIQANEYTNSLTLSQEEIEIQAINDKYRRQLDLAEQFGEDTKALEEAKQNEINAVVSTGEKQRTLTIEEETAKRKKEEEALKEFRLSSVRDGFAIIGELTTLFGKKNEKAAKAAFNVNKAAAIGEATITTYLAAQKAYASQIIPGDPTSIVRGGIAAGLAVASGLVRVAKIASTKFQASTAPSGGGGSEGSVATPNQNTQSAVPQVNLFGGANQFNTAQNQGNAQGMVVKAVVSETEITAKQGQINKFEQLSVL